MQLSWERPRTGHVQAQEGQWVDVVTGQMERLEGLYNI